MYFDNSAEIYVNEDDGAIDFTRVVSPLTLSDFSVIYNAFNARECVVITEELATALQQEEKEINTPTAEPKQSNKTLILAALGLLAVAGTTTAVVIHNRRKHERVSY